MAQKELPITLEEQIDMMKKYVSFRQRIRMRRFLLHAGYFRASRYGKFLDRKSTRLNSSHPTTSRMQSSA